MRAWAIVLICASIAACATGQLADDTNGGDSGLDSSTGGDGNKAGSDAGGDGAATCTSPSIICPGDAGCVDLKSNADHCGTCTTTCMFGDASALTLGSNDNPDSGVPPQDSGASEASAPWSVGSTTCEAGTCGIDCPPGTTLCSDDICYDTTQFHEHCGNCTTACMPTEYCSDGNCCTQGTAWCGTSCIDVLSDPSNCGTCGNACPMSAPTCTNGTCTTCTNKNVALTATATISSGGSISPYLPSDANDGVLETSNCSDFAWITAGNTAGTAWIQYTWTSAQKLTAMHMDTTSATKADSCGNLGRTLGAAEIQWWNGSSWITDGSVSAKLDDWDYTFTSTITTTEVRLYALYCTNTMGQTSNPQVYEWQVTGCN
jgi:hypothetical protein